MNSSLKDAEIAAEQRHVDLAYARLEEMRTETRRLLRDSYRLADAGTRSALVDRDAMVYQTALRAHTLDAVHEELVFGRLDMRNGERRYIGRLGVRTADRGSLVIDWRAPAAEPFYRATPEEPMGVVRRRVLHCRGERVRDLEDDLLDPAAAPTDMPVVGDGAFLAALSRSRGETMRDIVATIQREQDEVVRAPVDGTVIVSGGPGTGKTAVALHRVAWLLFRHRRRFGARGVLVVGPNPRFMAYIERVLPSLGEDAATLRSLGGVAEGVEAAGHDDPAAARVKGSGRMVRVLRRAAADVPPGAPDELRVTHRGTVVRIGSTQLARLRRQVNRTTRRRPNAARAEVAEALLVAAWRRMRELGTDPGTLPPDHAEFLEDVAGQRAFHEFLATWWPRRRPSRELLWLADRDRLARAAAGILDAAEVTCVAAALAGSARTGELTFADAALIDELDVILGPVPRRRRSAVRTAPEDRPDRPGEPDLAAAMPVQPDGPDALAGTAGGDGPDGYAHVVIDEAQDLSPMQWRMLGRRGRHATWTVVADPAQSAWEDTAESDAAMDRALGTRTRREYELTTNYRNPVEIAEVAARVLRSALPGARAPRAVRASGHRPVLRPVGAGELARAVRAEAAGLLARTDGTVAVVTAMRRREEAAAWVADERVQVIGSLETKGLEFDAVVLADPAEVAAESPAGLRTLYVTLTRATQRLVVIGRRDTWPEALSQPE